MLASVVAVLAMSAGCVGTDARAPSPTPNPTQEAGPRTVLLDLAGRGTLTTRTFSASGPWSVAWSFDCGAGTGGSFFLDVFKASDHTPDFKNRGVDAEGEQQAADTSYFADPGTFYLEITSSCAWSVEVFE